MIPTASSTYLGTGKWNAGLAGVFMTKAYGLTLGILAQQFFSFAGDSHRADQNFMIFQPIITKILHDGYCINSSPIMKLDWENSDYNIPIGLNFGKAFAKNLSMFIGREYVVSGPEKGSDLEVKKEETPSFLVWALKDPMNANLDRIQIIKGWYENGELKEQIYNLAASDNRLQDDGTVTPTDAKVNLETAAYDTTKGNTEFMITWSDSDFDANKISFYYVRVLQIPTARWNLFDEIRDNVKFPDQVAKTVQERVWSSPIWYTPK